MTTILLIKNGYIVIIDGKNTRISDGAIFVKDNEIKFVDKTQNVEKLPRGSHEVSRYNLRLTKIIDATTGLFNWIEFLYELWRKITPEWIEISTRVGMAELLLTDCTTTLD